MTIQVNIHEAKTRLSELLKAVERGERVIIARAGEPVAVLNKADLTDLPTPKFKLGFAKGRFVAPDDIKTPFKDDIEEMFGLKG